MKKIWTLDYIISLILSGQKEKVRVKYFRWCFYKPERCRDKDMHLWCRRISKGDGLAFGAWLKLTKCQRDHVIEAALRYDPFAEFIWDGKIILG